MQTITKNRRVICVTQTPYPADVVKSMKAAGYKVKEGGETNDRKNA